MTMDFSNPNNIALAAILGGGRILQGSVQPGGSFGQGLANAFTQTPQDIMQFAQAQQMSKMRELQMARAQQEMQQAQAQQAARQQIATNMQVQAAQGQPGVAAPLGSPIPHIYRAVPQDIQNMSNAIGSGDAFSTNVLQNQQQMQMAQQAAIAKARRQAEMDEYQRQQDAIANSREEQGLALRYGDLDVKRGNLALKQREAKRGRYGEPKAGIDPTTGQEGFYRFNESTGKMDLVPGAAPRERVGVFGEGGMQISKDGTISFGAGKRLPSSAESESAKSVIETENRARSYDQIIRQAKPEYFELSTKTKDFWHEMKSSLGEHEFDQMLSDRDDFIQKATQESIQIRNQLLGAALTEGEKKASEGMLPDPKKDSYQKFVSKAISLKYASERYAQRHKDYLQSGIRSKEEFASSNPISNYETAQSRGDELFERYTSLGMSPEDALKRAREELLKERGR